MFKLDLEKAVELEIKLPIPRMILKKNHQKSKRVTEKHLLLFYFYAKAFDCVDHNKLEISRDGNARPTYLPPEKPFAGQEAIVRTIHGTTDWFIFGKGVHQGCIVSPCLFNLYAEYIM